ncbi:hypothetical protein LOTGIDRAFT_172905 [Lottia gigantea]|uniref:Uncharacterized protein n=1 Tax=Lottia gigantea TaxID=225164 RepID=V4B4T1_LOTGI|nr:hypothetical protein LOTGIDRAFT_172905 [Lottia gigantea]ESP00977.1 hypothetical protein LOTGIDRAFT_172905 [Lottia gigantea]
METFLTRRYINDSHTSLRDDFDWDLNEISRSSSPLSARSEGPRHHHHHHQSSRSRHESRRKLAKLENESKTNWSKLRNELEIEKVKNREMQKEKDELRKWKENYEQERKKELISLEDKLKKENKKLVHKIKSELEKEKDEELQKVLKYKDDEIKQLRASMSQDELSCSESVSSRLNISMSTTDGRDTASNILEKTEDQSILLRKMEEEIQRLKDEKLKLEEKYGRKCKENRRKDKEFLKMKDQYDKELRKILAESKKLAECNLKKLKIAELALSENFVSDDESVSLKSLLSPDNESSKLGLIAEKIENPKLEDNEPSPPDILQQTGNIQENSNSKKRYLNMLSPGN